jgi:hypothetical protein
MFFIIDIKSLIFGFKKIDEQQTLVDGSVELHQFLPYCLTSGSFRLFTKDVLDDTITADLSFVTSQERILIFSYTGDKCIKNEAIKNRLSANNRVFTLFSIFTANEKGFKCLMPKDHFIGFAFPFDIIDGSSPTHKKIYRSKSVKAKMIIYVDMN